MPRNRQQYEPQVFSEKIWNRKKIVFTDFESSKIFLKSILVQISFLTIILIRYHVGKTHERLENKTTDGFFVLKPNWKTNLEVLGRNCNGFWFISATSVIIKIEDLLRALSLLGEEIVVHTTGRNEMRRLLSESFLEEPKFLCGEFRVRDDSFHENWNDQASLICCSPLNLQC